MQNSAAVEVVSSIAERGETREEMFIRMCELLGIPTHQMVEFRKCLPDVLRCVPRLNTCAPALERFVDCSTTIDRIPDLCTRLDEVVLTCDSYKKQMATACCPGQQLYGNVTLDAFSSITTVDLEKIVTGLGAPYVDSYPVPSGSTVRMIQIDRPGYVPEEIEINLVLANGGTNYLNVNVQFFVGATKIGPLYKGSHFLDADGRTKKIKFPKWRDQPVTIGTSDILGVEISITGPNSLEYATVTVHVDASAWYQLCAV